MSFPCIPVIVAKLSWLLTCTCHVIRDWTSHFLLSRHQVILFLTGTKHGKIKQKIMASVEGLSDGPLVKLNFAKDESRHISLMMTFS